MIVIRFLNLVQIWKNWLNRNFKGSVNEWFKRNSYHRILQRMVTIRRRPKYESAVNVFALPNFEGVRAHFIAIPAICSVLFPLWTIWRRFLSAMSPILMIARVRIVRNSRWTRKTRVRGVRLTNGGQLHLRGGPAPEQKAPRGIGPAASYKYAKNFLRESL